MASIGDQMVLVPSPSFQQGLRGTSRCWAVLTVSEDTTRLHKSATGFSSGVDQQLLLASKVLTCEEWKKYVVVLIDEMQIRYM